MKRAEHAGPSSWRKKKKLFNLENETLLLTYDSSAHARSFATAFSVYLLYSHWVSVYATVAVVIIIIIIILHFLYILIQYRRLAKRLRDYYY